VGFRVVKTHGGNHKDNSTVSWLIQDPRGFEIELSSLGLSYLLENCHIENGEILEKCVWARFNSWNVLLPVESGLYRDAIRNTKRIGTRTSLRLLKPGNKIITIDGVSGTFLGFQYLIVKRYYSYKDIELTSKKVAIIGMNPDADGFDNLYIIKNLRISEITDNTVRDLKECVELVNGHIANRKKFDGSFYTQIVGSTLSPTLKINKRTKLQRLASLDINALATQLYDVVAELENGTFGILGSYDVMNNHRTFTFRPFDANIFPANDLQLRLMYVKHLNQNDLTKCRFYSICKTIETAEGRKMDLLL